MVQGDTQRVTSARSWSASAQTSPCLSRLPGHHAQSSMEAPVRQVLGAGYLNNLGWEDVPTSRRL
eukprot:2861344-Rhodomonas_salina.1